MGPFGDDYPTTFVKYIFFFFLGGPNMIMESWTGEFTVIIIKISIQTIGRIILQN
jgi:hypothetical protein